MRSQYFMKLFLVKVQKASFSYIYIVKYVSQKEILQAKCCRVAYTCCAQGQQYLEETAKQTSSTGYNALHVF